MGSEYMEHHMAKEDHRETPEYEAMGMEQKVREYWRLSSLWNGRRTPHPSENYSVRDFLDIINGLAQYTSSNQFLVELLHKLSNNVIHMKRCKRKTNRGLKNVVRLSERTKVKYKLPPAVTTEAEEAVSKQA